MNLRTSAPRAQTGVSGNPQKRSLDWKGEEKFTKYPLATLLLVIGSVHGQDTQPLTQTGRIDLSNVNGRIDHFSADVKGNRLFMSALGNHTVEVLDVASGKRLRTLSDLAEPQGAYYDPSTNRLFIACAKDGTTKIFDGSTFQLLSTVKFSADADNVRYDARGQKVVVGYGDGALAFVDTNGKKTGEIPLEGHPESFQLEKTGTRVFVNVPDHKEIQVADLVKNTMLAKWPVTTATRNYPMAIYEARHRLLIGCRSPARMLVIDTESGKQTASVEIVGDSDDLFYDAARDRVYVIGGQGFVDVFEQNDGDHCNRIAHIATAPGARTGLFVPEWSKLFVAVPHRGEQRAEVLVYETK
jgi:DNA-binding beta-propeller fold protein YncE